MLCQNTGNTTAEGSKADVKSENSCLTGKRIREISREREQQRLQQKEDHQQKREKEIAKLLTDHEEELARHEHLISPVLPPESPLIGRARARRAIVNQWGNSKNWYSASSTRTGIQTVVSSRQNTKRTNINNVNNMRHSSFEKSGLAKKGKFSVVSESEFCNRNDQLSSRTDDLSSLTFSHDSSEVSSDTNHGSADALARKGNDELDRLLQCLQTAKNESSKKTSRSVNYSSWSVKNVNIKDKKSNKNDQTQNSTVKRTSNAVFSNVQCQKSGLEPFGHMNATFTLPLDRISEVDSNDSSSSTVLNGNDRNEESRDQSSTRSDVDCNGHEDASSYDLSWCVPNDVKKLLYG